MQKTLNGIYELIKAGKESCACCGCKAVGFVLEHHGKNGPTVMSFCKGCKPQDKHGNCCPAK